MNLYLRCVFILLSGVISVVSYGQEGQSRGGCEVTFDITGYDTLCSTSAPFNVPPGLPFGGTYSGPGMEADFFNPALTGPGQFEIFYTYDDGVCSGIASAVMTVIDADGLTFLGNFELCAGDTAIISSPDGQEYTWENGVKNDSMIFVIDTSITSYATGTDANGCVSLTEFDIEVSQMPQIVLEGPEGLCIGEIGVYTVSGADSWTWFNGSTQPSVTFLGSTSFVVSVSSSAGACDTTASIDVLVQPYPVLIYDAPSAVCYGDSLILNPTGAILYKGPNGFFTETQSIYVNQDMTITLQAYNEAGCMDEMIFDVMVLDLPVFTLTATDSICLGGTANASVVGGYSYVWSDLTNNVELQASNLTFINVTPTVSTDYQVEIFEGNECSAKGLFHVEVMPLPELFVEELEPICTNRMTSLLASGASTYEWNNETNDNPYFLMVPSSMDVTLSGTSEFGCTNSISYFLDAHESPVVAISGTPIICEGESSLLTASGADFYTWPDGTTEITNMVYPIADSIFMLTGSTFYGCSDFTNYQITVRPAPDLVISGEDTICAGGTLHLEATSDFDILWEDGSDASSIDVVLVEDSVITATSVGVNGCVSEVGFYCFVRPFPLIDVSGDTELCAGESTTLTASGPSELIWSNGTEGGEVTLTPVTTTNYYITGLDDFGCEVTNQIPVIVHQVPYVYFEFSADTTCDYNEALSWQANPPGGLYSGDGVVDGNFIPTEAIDGDNTVTYAVTNEAGCTTAVTDVIFIEDCVGFIEVESSELDVYPNPADDFLTIRLSRGGLENILMYDARGALVIHQQNVLNGASTSINVGDLSAGLYELKVSSHDGQIWKKTIIVR
ncbi:MAG: T9SS type A sorting domain-containing protein [Flavobacteriales bacterium]|nr:T9SS type A sorting domain-containing protein [Flavobacteriales bacterium]